VAKDESLLQELVSEDLGSVVFVADYVQLDFNGPRLSLFVWPEVKAFGESKAFGDPGYRDLLCTFIDRTVTAALESPDDGLVLSFEADSVCVNPRAAFELTGPEIGMLHLNDQDRQWDVWRPGEGVFESGDW
jgi:hypothetical protein